MSENIQELQDQQIEIQQENLHYFNMKSFATNIVILMLLITFTSMIHRFFVIKRTRIKGFHFLENRKIVICTFEQFARSNWITMIYLGMNFAERQRFINHWGLEIFNFLNFEVKMMFLCVFYMSFISIQSLCYFVGWSQDVNYLDFLVGDFHFDHYAGLMTIFAIVFAASLYLVIHILERDCRKTALTIFTSKISEASINYSYVKNLVFFSKLDRCVEKQQIVTDIATALGIPPSNFLLILFPKMKNLCKRQLQINELTDSYYYWTSPKNPIRFFVTDITPMTSRYFANLETLKAGLNSEYKKPLKHSGRGVILFYDFDDTEKLHDLRRAFKEGVKNRRPSFSGDDTRSASARRLMIEHKFYTMCSYNDLVIPNVDKFIHSYKTIRVLLYAILAIVLLFISTPMSVLQTLIRIGLVSHFQDSLLVQVFHNEFGKYVVESVFPLLTYAINLFLIVAIELTGQSQKFARHSFYQEFILRTSFVYLLINMLIMPGLLFGGSASLFDFLTQSSYNLADFSFNVRLYETGNFFTNIILQSGAFSFISLSLTIGMLIRKRGSFSFVQKYLRSVRLENYRKEVEDLYEFGYNYSYDCAIFYIVIVFGIYQPLILFAGSIYFLLKSYANVGTLTGFYKEQVYMKTKMTDMVLRRLRLAVPLMLFVLTLKCIGVKKVWFALFNGLLCFLSFTYAFVSNNKAFDTHDLLKETRNERRYIASIGEFRSEHSRNDANYKQRFMEKIVDQIVIDRLVSKGSAL